MNTRTFGVEIEAYNVPQQTVSAALNAAGIPCEVQGYNHTDSATTWKIVNDSSIHGPADGSIRGAIANTFELVSPILQGEAGLAQVNTVCDILVHLGAKVNKSCGLHVHHDARDLDLGDWKNLLALYVNYEGAIDALMPESRRGNQSSYCQSVRRFGSIDETAERIMDCDTLEELSGLFANRYVKVNFSAFWIHGTIEFRHHSGTVEADKIVNWIQLTSLMLDKAQRAQGIVLSPDDDTDRKLTSLLATVKAPASMKRFYQARRDHFATGR